jgi:putative SOS response-associated peptidase YedK
MLATPREQLVAQFRLQQASALVPRYNIAPSQPIAAVRQFERASRELVMLHWGLVPHWAKQRLNPYRMINARAETLAEKSAFDIPFRRRRCMVPADGYYEWQVSAGRKQPFLIRAKNGRPLALAALWDRWEDKHQGIESCAIVTTAADQLLRPIHDRMPLILSEDDYALWLDPAVSEPSALRALLVPFDGNALVAQPVSTHVNSPANDDPGCIAPLASGALS